MGEIPDETPSEIPGVMPREIQGEMAREMPGRMLGEMPGEILTIGHSTRSLDEFLDLLRASGVKLVVDVRTVPRSRHNPQFNADTLPVSLRSAGIDYVHRKSLGGLRHPDPESRNTAWHNASFRGFADYMKTEAFVAALDDLVALAGETRAALLCAEAVPWRCHRSLIADALDARGIRVAHIVGPGAPRPHRRTPFARVRRGRVDYPAGEEAGYPAAD